MNEELIALREQLRREAAPRRQRMFEALESELTDEELQRDWDRLCAHKHSAARKSSWNFPKLVLTMGIPAAAVAILFLMLLPGGFNLSSKDGISPERGFDPTALPKNMRLNLAKQTLRIYESGDKLSGTLTPLSQESNADEAVYHVQMQGTDRDGKGATLSGRMRIVRKGPNLPVANKADIKRVIVEGDFSVGNQAAQPVSRSYDP